MNFKKLFTGLAAFALVLGTLSPIAGLQEVFAAGEGATDPIDTSAYGTRDNPTTLDAKWIANTDGSGVVNDTNATLVITTSNDVELVEIDGPVDAHLNTLSGSRTLTNGVVISFDFENDEDNDKNVWTISFSGDNDTDTLAVINLLYSSNITITLWDSEDSKNKLLGSTYYTTEEHNGVKYNIEGGLYYNFNSEGGASCNKLKGSGGLETDSNDCPNYEKIRVDVSLTDNNNEVEITQNDPFTFTVAATGVDAYQIASLEVDHSLEGILPEFTVYPNADNPWGDNNAKARADSLGVELAYIGTDLSHEWVFTFETPTSADDKLAMNTILTEGEISFYIALRSQFEDHIWGTMYGTTDENTGTYQISQTSTMSLEGFSNQTMTVGQSQKFNGMIRGLTWVDDGLYTMTLNGQNVEEGDLEITTSGEYEDDILGVSLPFNVGDDEEEYPYADVALDITIKANKAGTYTLVFTMNKCEESFKEGSEVDLVECDVIDEDGSFTKEFVLTVNNKSSGGGGGGYTIGGGSNPSDTPADTDTSDDDTNTDTDSSSTPTQEQSDAYEFAYEYGITTMGSLATARVSDPVTRAEFAKMISVFAEQFTDASLDIDASCEFSDLDAVNDELAGFIEKACQYGIMGQNMGDHFRPNDIISRAEVATTISRLLGLASDGEEMYYVPHLQAMMDAGYITQNTPDIAELRGYMFIMLQRIAEIE